MRILMEIDSNSCQELQPFLEWNTNGIVARSDWLPLLVMRTRSAALLLSFEKEQVIVFYWLIMQAFS